MSAMNAAVRTTSVRAARGAEACTSTASKVPTNVGRTVPAGTARFELKGSRSSFLGTASRTAGSMHPVVQSRKSASIKATLADDLGKTATQEQLDISRQSAGPSAIGENQTPPNFVSRFTDEEERKGCDILVEALEREGVDVLFAYPGGASMEIHQALTRSETITNILCRHEQGEVFAAEGYAKSTGRVGVCIATSGPGATNLVTGLADAMLDSVPMVAITGQVPRRMIGTDAFQETPIVEISRQITKHNYLVLDVNDIPRVIHEAFYLAASGRPGPVLVDIPKDIQQQMHVPNWKFSMSLTSYISRLPPPPTPAQLRPVIDQIAKAQRPVLYVGGGANGAAEEIAKFARANGIPVTTTLMGLGAVPSDEKALGTTSLGMLGMHGTVYANYAIDKADLLLAFGVRFDDRVTGKLESFATRASICHIDIDPAELDKNKEAHVAIAADILPCMRILNDMVEKENIKFDFSSWREELAEQQRKFPMTYPEMDDKIVPQYAIETLHELTEGKAIVSTGVGQHQMWSAQWYKFSEPRRWLTSGGLGSMGFGLPAALGAAAAHDGKNGRPKAVVVDIDGDGSFMMNCQELATIHVDQLDVKIMILNNQHLGMVVQWEDRFYKANRAHTYLGSRDAEFHETGDEVDIFPDLVKMAESCRVPAKRVMKKSELRAAIQEMLDTPGPYLLDVMVPHIEHVLPMIPGGGSFKDIITSGSGADEY
eukprot:CAMPEP_0182864054 /NCGR_PEP_ID=MMETSP0034_2-20130328/6969_1 /TAXON_ID=156128 /ORGANISM="Nephroselmis pyriformis, Strain CCMP717" /LENGTH=712 /DNA_ID=CAMNT_0024996301 /DNA_START=35 /DNA_END=2173 /DNA_ORIENTATION=+